MNIPSCHPERKYKAKGLCKPCYDGSRYHAKQRKLHPTLCHPDRKHKARGLCLQCWRAEQYKKIALSIRAKNLKRDYGISLEDYAKLLASQGGGCAICSRERNKGKRSLSVDHDHVSGKIRGILCDRCNSMLGQLEATPNRILEVLTYLSIGNGCDPF